MPRSKSQPDDQSGDQDAGEIVFTPSDNLLHETPTSGEPEGGIHPDSSPAAQGTAVPEPGIAEPDVDVVDTRDQDAIVPSAATIDPKAAMDAGHADLNPSPELAPEDRGQTDPYARYELPTTPESRPVQEQDRPGPAELEPGAEVPEDERWVRVQAGPNLIHVFEKLYDGTLRHHRTETGTL